MPVWFETGISQSMAWTLLSPYLIEVSLVVKTSGYRSFGLKHSCFSKCPAENPRIEWNIFPTLNILNNPNLTDPNIPAALSTNRTQFISVNSTLHFSYDAPGMNVSYNNSYVTAVGANVTTSIPSFCKFVNQLNVTSSPFNSTGNGTGMCQLPGGFVFGDGEWFHSKYCGIWTGEIDTKVAHFTDPINNGTMFVMLTSEDTFVTP